MEWSNQVFSWVAILSVIGALAIHVLAHYVTRGIDALLSRTSAAAKQRADAARKKRLDRIETLRNDQKKWRKQKEVVLFLAFFSLFALITSVFWLSFSSAVAWGNRDSFIVFAICSGFSLFMAFAAFWIAAMRWIDLLEAINDKPSES